MNHHDEDPDSGDSLLRRMLQDSSEGALPPDDEPVPLDRHVPEGKPLSPVRPAAPEEPPPHPPLAPSLPAQRRGETDDSLTPREQLQRAEEALIHLREKMAEVAAEYAQGQLNKQQFEAIYGRYSEQRDITERLLVRDPQSQAWQSVIQAGHTQFLKDRYEARVLSYAIYDLKTSAPITLTGDVQIARSQVRLILSRLNAVMAQRGNPGPARQSLRDGRCVVIVPGEHSVAVAIFSLEPAAAQVQRIHDLHTDFERANHRALLAGDFDAGRLVFPHRALFESDSH